MKEVEERALGFPIYHFLYCLVVTYLVLLFPSLSVA